MVTDSHKSAQQFEFIRNDSFLFYTLGIISFLESAAPIYVKNLCLLFKENKDFTHWLQLTWAPEEEEHGRLIRHYLQKTWPEFDWPNAYSAYCLQIPRDTTEHLNNSRALEAYSRCVTETETTMIYRALAEYTTDIELKKLWSRLSSDEVRHYRIFKSIFQHHQKFEKNSRWRVTYTLIRRTLLVKNRDLSLGFHGLNTFWSSPPPFSSLSYREYSALASQVMAEYFPLNQAKRMLFNPMKLSPILTELVCWFLTGLYPGISNQKKHKPASAYLRFRKHSFNNNH